MINFKSLELNKEKLRLKYLTAIPFPHLVINDICDEKKLLEAYASIPILDNKSRDYMFAKNKFEKSNYGEISPLLKELQEDLRSDEMNKFLSFITTREVFVDPKNHGGGLHQGRKSSFLDMHLDYNYHPINNNWWREVNILLYMNKDWKQDFGGHLELKDLRTGKEKKCDVDFNTLIIQECHDYTLHGYRPTNFPEGNFRTSIATYAFSKHIQPIYDRRTTDWFPDKQGDSKAKKWFGRNFKNLISVKNMFFGSGTAKNQ